MGPESWSALANWVMAGAAVLAACAARSGLNSWKNQNIWTADAELARRILIALYRFRDSLYAVRHPAMFAGEMRLDAEQESKLSEVEQRQESVRSAYSRRWSRHQEQAIELSSLMIEADAVWGEELSKKVSELRKLERELWAYINLYLDAHYSRDTELAREYRKILKGERNILYDMLKEDDVFRMDFVKALAPVERYLRGKLGRGR
ncbi:hypothetical protein [Albidovulum sediminis]|uniref:DUF4760 domain-containing protein n=1 Tax=Albidovulum sediminis TaxID=3066345 RepID=A0ABT2NQB6_9RHOB|nr:hypothetical protein [Defluviimonas sediminis]MCT8330283.1 hypothetical protein [Defluviimonas sediminis]